MDVTRYYRDGFTTTILPAEMLADITFEARLQNFRPESKNHPEVFFPSENQTPAIWKFWKELSQSSYYDYLRNIWGDFTYFYPWTYKYSPDQQVPFHHDLERGMKVLNILYLTFESFEETDGGYLKVARLKRQLPSPNLYELEKGDVVKEWKVIPNNGVLVTLNNINPLVVHGVEKLVALKDRYTLSCMFGHES